MCGIAGFLRQDRPAEVAAVKAMCDAMRHRGPDDEGFHVSGGCGIGMRRLSIIDLSTGHQPISNEDGSVWIVFNGEIYNFQDLRRELMAKGHRFRTNSDTETIIHLYEEEDTAGLERLRGMFAFCIWDQRRRSILLARDRFGKKPLYYCQSGRDLYFASEIKCLRAAGAPLGEIDREGLGLYFQFAYVPDPYSAYGKVRKLPAGSWLRYDAPGNLTSGVYWKLPVPRASADGAPPEEEVCERLRDKFDESVRIRMISDVPLGAFLSGGIDSASVVASMARHSAEPVKTFSIGFEEQGFSELDAARLVAQKYGTDHHEIVVRPDAVSLVEKLVRHFDEPFADSSAVPTFLVSEFAARHVKVALSGDGGDELFAGYTSTLGVQRLSAADRLPAQLRRLISGLAGVLPYSAYGKNYLRMISRPDSLERYLEFNSAPYYLRRRLLTPEWRAGAENAFVKRALAACILNGDTDPVTQALYFDATANLTGDMLVKVDRMSMANSLEVRCPLLDHGLAALAAEIPHCMKIRHGQGKYILRRALGGRLPPELLRLPKKGFSIPLAQWFRGPLREFLHDHVTGRLLGRGIVSPSFVRHLVEEHGRGRRDNNRWLWTLLMLELWFREMETAR